MGDIFKDRYEVVFMAYVIISEQSYFLPAIIGHLSLGMFLEKYWHLQHAPIILSSSFWAEK